MAIAFNKLALATFLIFVTFIIWNLSNNLALGHGGFDHDKLINISELQKSRLEESNEAVDPYYTQAKCEDKILLMQENAQIASVTIDYFDKIIDRLNLYVETTKLNPQDYSQILTSVEMYQQEAQTEITVLKLLSFEIECTSENYAQYRQAIISTTPLVKDALVGYQKASLELLDTVKEAEVR